MKDFMSRVIAFLTFDHPLQVERINLQFAKTHLTRQAQISDWSTASTRQQLISIYWSKYMPSHFAVLLGLPAAIIFSLDHHNDQLVFYLGVLLVAGLISFSCMYLFYYRQIYSAFYLPLIETAKESYEHKQAEQLEKCRQAQLSNFALSLFFFVFADINRLGPLTCDDYSANLLMKLYGVDPGSIKKSFELILGTAKRKNLTDRKVTELRNRFTETYEFMESLKFTRGIQKLKELEVKFFLK